MLPDKDAIPSVFVPVHMKTVPEGFMSSELFSENQYFTIECLPHRPSLVFLRPADYGVSFGVGDTVGVVGVLVAPPTAITTVATPAATATA